MTSPRHRTRLPSASVCNRPVLRPKRSRSRLAVLASLWWGWTLGVLGVVLLVGCSPIHQQTGSTSSPYARKSQDAKSSSGLGGLFHKEPEPPKSVKDWMNLRRLDP